MQVKDKDNLQDQNHKQGHKHDQKQANIQLTPKQVVFLTSENVLAERMRYLLAALEGYKIPWMLAEVLLQSSDEERKLWQQLEEMFVYAKKSNDVLAKEIANNLKQWVKQGWLEFRVKKARAEGLDLARSLDPELLVEQGQQLQFSENPYDLFKKSVLESAHHITDTDLDEALRVQMIEAWRQGFHNYLCLIREESW
ncbi:hypothetical protein [Thiomicrorhabdus sp. Milos-T2]|uniref:hypothetical protein n=1 Tax=Thiomicrorhabdus sp. Milos-T2 TaxID=90814 RepID=UPI000494241C|nr:hypothetical protein [Thiomicrorhabdus sp. Milos-T2]